MATTIDFPEYLPMPLREGYQLNHVSPFARTDMANGRARQRRMFTSVPSMVPVAFLLTDSQAQVFEAWFKYEINDGADWFNCKLDSPDGQKEYECRFTDIYQGPQLVGKRFWRFTAELEIIERPVLPEDWYRNGLQFIAYSSIIDLAINREWPQ